MAPAFLRFAFALTCVVLAHSATSVPVCAQAPQDARPSAEAPDADEEPAGYRKLVADALAEYEAGHFEESRALMQRAHALFPSARTLRGLGMVSFELREYGESVRELEQALASEVRPLSGELRAQTQRLLERARSFAGRLTLSVEPGSTRVFLDGVELGPSASREIVLSVGEHALEFRAEGYLAERRSVRIVGGENELLRITLLPLPAANDPSRSERRSWYQNPWFWASAGVVLAAGAATTTALLLTRDEPEQQAPYLGLSGEPTLTGPAQ
jgi:hypothetical protein